MRTVRARAADEAWLPLLECPGFVGVVQSASDHAVNIRLPTDQLLWVLDREASRTPNSLLTDAEAFAVVAVDDEVHVDADALLIGTDVLVELPGHERFSCQVFQAPRPMPRDVAARLEEAGRVLLRCGAAGGFLLSARPVAVERAIHQRLASASTAFQDALSGIDVRVAGKAAHALVGLGVGSTPSGDDYLLGCLVVLRIYPDAADFEALASVLRPVVADTTAISRSYLLAGLDGRFHEDVGLAANAIISGDHKCIRGAVQRVAGLGATSGTDTMIGMVETVATVSGVR